MYNSLQRQLVILGLIVIPFYEIFLKALPFVQNVASDTRANKALIAMVFALAIGLLAVFQGIKPFSNKWLLAIPVYLLFSLIMAPQADLFLNGIQCGDFYFFKPFAQALCFLFLVLAVANMEFSETILKVMVWCCFIMSCYVIAQKLGFDQFWAVKDPAQYQGAYPNGEIGGNLGQTTLVASFIIIGVPLAMYLRKYWMLLVMSIAILVAKSDMAIFALLIIALISLFRFLKISFKDIGIATAVILAVLGVLIYQNKPLKDFIKDRMSGRALVWKETAKDIRDGAIEGAKTDASFTGVGLGRFSFIFPERHHSIFSQAHNEYLEFTYNCGLVGLSLFLIALFVMFKSVLMNLNPLSYPIALSFFGLLICAGGVFVFQLGSHQYYSAILVGFLHNDSIIRRV